MIDSLLNQFYTHESYKHYCFYWVEETINSCAYDVWVDQFNKKGDSKIVVTDLK